MKKTESASKKLGRDEALALLREAKSITIANGKKVQSYALDAGADLDQIVEEMLGRTGNLRAPTMRVGKALFVGFPKGGFDALRGGG